MKIPTDLDPKTPLEEFLPRTPPPTLEQFVGPPLATSSIHSSPIDFLSVIRFSCVLLVLISLLISSVSVEYWVTAKMPPCLMLFFFISIGLVFPKAVLIVAVGFWLQFVCQGPIWYTYSFSFSYRYSF